MTEHILQRRGPKRWPPAIFNGQPGCFCCPPPPPPEPSGAVYYGYSRREFPYCAQLNFVPFALPDYLTVTVTSTNCTCLSGLSWQIQRRTLTDTGGTKPECQWGTAASGTCLGSRSLSMPIGVVNYNGFGWVGVPGCNSGNGKVAFYFRPQGGVTGTDYWVMNFGVCGSSEGQYGESNLNIAPTSINPFLWTMNTEGFGWTFQNFCPNGSFSSHNWVLTVTE